MFKRVFLCIVSDFYREVKVFICLFYCYIALDVIFNKYWVGSVWKKGRKEGRLIRYFYLTFLI